MKKAFTLIELIFVIVILGILATVALPKFIGVAQQAHESNLKSFVGTLNRTVGGILWSKSLSDGHNGSITSYTNYNSSNFLKLSDIPKEINVSSINFSKCTSSLSAGNNSFAESNYSVTGSYYKIVCRDGNITTPPRFALYDINNKCLIGCNQ